MTDQMCSTSDVVILPLTNSVEEFFSDVSSMSVHAYDLNEFLGISLRCLRQPDRTGKDAPSTDTVSFLIESSFAGMYSEETNETVMYESDRDIVIRSYLKLHRDIAFTLRNMSHLFPNGKLTYSGMKLVGNNEVVLVK